MISKKTRNTLISKVGVLLLGCTLIFGLINPLTTKADEKKVKNVIYLIADGMSDGILTAAKYYNDIQDGTLGNDKLAMESIRSGFVKTAWANGPITDSAPAAFSAHIESRQDYNSIMKQQVYKDMEVVLGGGSLFFESTGGGKRNDGKDLTEDIKALGYDYVTTKSEMNESTSDKLWGLFASLAEGKSDEEIKELIKKYYGYTDITSEELEYAKNGQINEVMKISAKLGYTTGGHTGGDVYLGVYAPAGVEKLRGTVDNTELPKYIASNLGLNLDSASETLYQDIKCKIEADGATFTVNTDDSENPYFLIEKEGKTLKVIANSNIVEVSMDGEKIEDKKLSSVSILIGENAYGNADEIVEILNEEVSHLKAAIKF
ncbi:alkaline phosphatase [Clostridium sp. D43t1_170807_H7]|uniref:alkaline phosphatase n=1 Tax=Clostridium sp. D43t1_170807_H7 TaxID=2787140 RepID=UPI001897D5D6|nr:alkaline phosphatase [Clostridium sp. D43t1_170807_H7]